jgi:hypothetical protein
VRTLLTIGVTVLVVVFYAATIGLRGVLLLGSGSTVGVLLGIALLVVPVLGVALVLREVQFGRETARLARDLGADGGPTVADLPRRPSGRVDRAAADAVFEQRRRETEQHPDDWRTWFRLALAYDAAGDRARARAAARHAIALHG